MISHDSSSLPEQSTDFSTPTHGSLPAPVDLKGARTPQVDWAVIRQSILDNLDIAEEFRRLGVEFTITHPNEKGWRECRAIDREDRHPSAGVNVKTGFYKSFGEGSETLNLFDFAMRYGHTGSFEDTFRHYANRAGIDLYNLRRGSKDLIEEAIYTYRDEKGEIVYESIRYRKPDGGKTFRLRRPDGQGGFHYNLEGTSPLLYKLPELLAADPNCPVLVVEGEKDAERAWAEGLVATCNHGGTGNTQAWDVLASVLQGRQVWVIADNDEPGRKHAREIAKKLGPHSASVRVVDLPDVPVKGDMSDYLDRGHSIEEFLAVAEQSPTTDRQDVGSNRTDAGPEGFLGFLGNPPDPLPVREELYPVPPLTEGMIPEAFRPWLADIAERMQCPLEFPVVGAIVTAGAIIGRRIAIRPKQRDDWTVVPNLWGAIVGSPGVMKSPALSEAMMPLRCLDENARRKYEAEFQDYERELEIAKAFDEERQRALRAVIKEGASDDDVRRVAERANSAQLLKVPPSPRHILQDQTVEKLGEILKDNPNGVLIFRDELVGFLEAMKKQGQETARSFYLEGWNGNGSFSFDRIGRGMIIIPSVCISILGGIQPGPLSGYFTSAAKHGGDHDGLISRFQLLVYPDVQREWRNVDEWPDTKAKARAFAIYRWIAELTPATVDSLGAETDPFDGPPFLRFAPDAQELFDWWRNDLETNKLRADVDDTLLISHLSKYRSLMPKLALVFHVLDIAEGRATGPVSLKATQLAAAWCDLLEAHARRIYGGLGDPAADVARRLAKRIKEGEVHSPFRCHQIANRGWSGLGSVDLVQMGVERLEKLNWVYRERIEPGPRGGRPKELVHLNPKLREGER